ncbi:MAG: flagellar export protein FliJ [Proteobacteria bacterium]|nr:flagellar export protein FliJ [Burkholderiales bacterium]
MTRPFPLQPLVELSADRVDAAARKLQALDAERRQAQDKLAQVEAFRREYGERLQQSLAQGMTVSQMREWHAFLAKLDAACKQQQLEVAVREEAWLAGQTHWMELRRRQKAFDALATRHQVAEGAREGRIDQRNHDELARGLARQRGEVDGGEGGEP